MGKTRLAKQTARELAKLVNKDTSEPALFLFFVNCERFGREKGADLSNIKLEIAQKVAAVDENLSKVLSSSTIDEFSTKLSMGLRQRVFLFLMDGIDPSCKGVISFLDNLVQHNENILVLTTSCAHFNLPRLGPNVSSYVCTGLEEDAAVALLREVAGNVKDLTEYQQELVSHCYFNPLLIMTVGQQMNETTCSMVYTAKEVHETFQHSFSLAVQRDNVPAKDDVFGNVMKLAKTISESIGTNFVSIVDQPSTYFTAGDVARDLGNESAAVVKKSFLQELSNRSILSQEDGFFSVSEIFKQHFADQRILLNQTQDQFVQEIYKELRSTLHKSLSQTGVVKMLMIHKDSICKISNLDKRISRVKDSTGTLKYAYQVQLIMACVAFLQNIPLSVDLVSEFKEIVYTILLRFQARKTETPFHNDDDQQKRTTDVSKQLNQLSISDKKSDKHMPTQRREILEAARRREPSPGHEQGRKEYLKSSRHGGDAGAQKDDKEGADDSVRDRFSLEVATSPFSSFNNFSSLSSSDDAQMKGDTQVPTEIGETATNPVNFICRNLPRHLHETQPSFQPSQPQEVSYHGDNSSLPPNVTLPEEQSFHEWESPASDATDEWSMFANAASSNYRNM